MVKGKQVANTSSTEESSLMVSDDIVTSFASMHDALAYFNAEEGVMNAEDVLGDGFTVIRDKTLLVNVPFLAVDWDFIPGEQGLYATVRVITSDGRKYRISDGSSGICKQLKDFTEKHITQRGLLVKGGLVKSEYPITTTGEACKEDDPNRDPNRQGSTFYLSTSSSV